MKKSVVIVAGGSGSRMGSTIPKQFLKLGDQPVIMHTISAFRSFDPSIQIVLVLPEDQVAYWKELCKEYDFYDAHKVTLGGSTRYNSVKSGLAKADGDVIAIHDAVRPLVSKGTIERCFDMAESHGNAVPVVSINDSVRVQTEEGTKAVDRSSLMIVQTPQVFTKKSIDGAYAQDYQDSFTDDASVIEFNGQKVNIVEGNYENIKITRPLDLVMAEQLLSDLA